MPKLTTVRGFDDDMKAFARCIGEDLPHTEPCIRQLFNALGAVSELDASERFFGVIV